ncbi:SCO6745 family protein [Geodermatophilus sp. SYSU D00815]
MVSVDQPAGTTVSADPKAVARAHRAVEPLHNHLYFVPEQDEHLTAVGLRPGRMCYFAGRAAPMGPVGPGVVAATFYNFSPSLVARHVPRAWTLASPEQVVAARFAAARASLTRLLGADAVAAPEVAELAGLLREACAVLTPEGRPLYAGHADLPWPEEPLLQLWHGATLLREHRGDGHLAALLRAGLTGLEALVTHTVTGRGFTEAGAKATRGWSDEEWAAAVASLSGRGLLDGDGLTADGAALRARIEAETDELSAAPWRHLGPERTARVVQLGKGFSARIAAGGAYPAGLFAGR